MMAQTSMTSDERANEPSMLPFAILIGGQLLSFVGTTLTGMAVGMWVFRETGSVITFAALTIVTLLPAILISPFGGVIADRFPRKPMMILVDSMSAISSLCLLFLLATGRMETWYIFVNAAISGISLGMQRPLYESVTPLMVPPGKLAFVNGLTQSIAGIGQILAPALAGILLSIGLTWIIALDLITFAIALACIIRVRVPNPPRNGAMAENWFAAFQEGWHFVRDRPGLYAMLWFVAVRNFLFAACEVIIVPFLLIIATPEKTGLVLSTAGLGIIVGGLLMGLLARSRRLIIWIILAQGMTGIAMILGGLTTDLYIIAAILAVAFLAFPIEEASSTTILQRKVPTEILGRVSSVRSMMNMSAPPLAMLVVAPLTDRVLEPLMQTDGLLAGSVGQLIGSGPGRGMALMIILTGLVTLYATWVGWRNRDMRNLELALPDQEHRPELADAAIAGGAPARA